MVLRPLNRDDPEEKRKIRRACWQILMKEKGRHPAIQVMRAPTGHITVWVAPRHRQEAADWLQSAMRRAGVALGIEVGPGGGYWEAEYDLNTREVFPDGLVHRPSPGYPREDEPE
jgi:hypothetical protein